MTFRHWQIGVHIQQDGVFIVALSAGRYGRALRRWWHLPLPSGAVVQGRIKAPEQLLDALRPWRHALPQRHCARIAFPAGQTLQRRLPHPVVTLREPALTSWVSQAMARELEMAQSDLCFDFTEDEPARSYGVTAAQNRDIASAAGDRAAAFTPPLLYHARCLRSSAAAALISGTGALSRLVR